METELYYLIANGGDGSASIDWYDDPEFARWYEEFSVEVLGDERYMWGESCGSSITITSDGPIVFQEPMYSKESVLISAIMEHNPDAAWYDNTKLLTALKDEWFGGEFPKFEVTEKDQHYLNVLLDEKVVGTVFRYGSSSDPVAVKKKLNTFSI